MKKLTKLERFERETKVYEWIVKIGIIIVLVFALYVEVLAFPLIGGGCTKDCKFTGETSFSYITLKDLTSDLTMKTQYGEVNIEEINPNFKVIDLTSNYTDILFTLTQQATLAVDIIHSEATVSGSCSSSNIPIKNNFWILS